MADCMMTADGWIRNGAVSEVESTVRQVWLIKLSLKPAARLVLGRFDGPSMSGFVDEEPAPMGDVDKPARALPHWTAGGARHPSPLHLSYGPGCA